IEPAPGDYLFYPATNPVPSAPSNRSSDRRIRQGNADAPILSRRVASRAMSMQERRHSFVRMFGTWPCTDAAREEQLGGDLWVGYAMSYQPDDFLFGRRQA